MLENSSASHSERNAILVEHLNELKIWARRLSRRGIDYDDALSELSCRIIPMMKDVQKWANKGAVLGFRAKYAAYKIMRDTNAQKRGVKDEHVDIGDVDVEAFTGISDPLLMKRLGMILPSLSERERLILDKYYLDDWDMQDIAAKLGVTKSALTSAHNGLKSKLKSMTNGGVNDHHGKSNRTQRT